MPPTSQLYTAVGFSAELDWKPLRFVQPIPQNRICGACGLVRRRSALLPCMHLLCESCYQQCVQNCGAACPLDNKEFQKEDAEWKESAADSVLLRKVRCWNEEAGCEAVLTASELLRHFRNECGHHCTSCPRCSANVLCGEVCAHLRSNCANVILSHALESREEPKETATSESFETLFHVRAAKMEVGLQQVVDDSKTQNQTLNEICHSINTLTEALEDKFKEVAEQSRDCFARNATDIRSAVKEVKDDFNTPRCTLNDIAQDVKSLKHILEKDIKTAAKRNCNKIQENAVQIGAVQMKISENNQKVSSLFEEVLAHISINRAFCYFAITDVSAQKEMVMREDEVDFTCDKIYLRGYCMLPGVYLKKKGECVTLHIPIELHMGVVDDFLQWPFPHSVKLSVIHPVSGDLKWDTYNPGKNNTEMFSKPVALEKKDSYLREPSFLLSDLERDGYVQDDRLALKYELLSLNRRR